MEKETELESLGERLGWLCVVVPGSGLGWIQETQVVQSFEDEYVTEAKSVGLKIRSMDVKAAPRAVASVLESIGPTLRSLILDFSQLSTQHTYVVAAAGLFCVHLQHFALKHSTVAMEAWEALLGALRGAFGSRLLALNLCAISVPEYPAMEMLTELLTQPGYLPLLQELRLDKQPVTLATLTNLDNALRFEKSFSLSSPRIALHRNTSQTRH